MDDTNNAAGQTPEDVPESPKASEAESPHDAHDDPEVKAAHDKLHQAREALHRAEQQYQKLRRRATEKVREHAPQVRDVVKDTLDMVRKHPALGVSIAALIGFFLGRLFRR